MELLLGKETALKIKEQVKNEVDKLEVKPKYVVLINKNDSTSIGYVNMQRKNATSLGIEFESIEMDDSEEQYIETIERLNNDKSVTAVMLTRPLFKGADEKKIISHLSSLKDVDAMSSASLGELFVGSSDYLAPCTAEAIMKLIKAYNIELKGKDVLVVGRSISVGRPVALMLLEENATVTIAHSRTSDLNDKLKNYDVIIAAVGKAHLIDASLCKEDAIIIDAGIHYLEDGSIVGDVKPSDKVKAISKVPGGVGTITSAVLMENIMKLYHKQRG